MKSAYVEDIYYEDTEVRITNLNVYYAGNSRAIKGIKGVRLGVFRALDDTRNSLISSAILLVGAIPMLLYLAGEAYSTSDLFNQIMFIVYLVLAVFCLATGIRDVIRLVQRDSSLPKGEVYGVVLKEQILEITTAVSTDRAYIEQIVNRVQGVLKNEQGKPLSNFQDPSDEPAPKPVIVDGLLHVGDTAYDAGNIQEIQPGTIGIINGFWSRQAQPIATALLFMSLSATQLGFTPVGVVSLLGMMGAYGFYFYAVSTRSMLGYILKAKGRFGSAIIYASTAKNTVDEIRRRIQTSIQHRAE